MKGRPTHSDLLSDPLSLDVLVMKYPVCVSSFRVVAVCSSLCFSPSLSLSLHLFVFLALCISPSRLREGSHRKQRRAVKITPPLPSLSLCLSLSLSLSLSVGIFGLTHTICLSCPAPSPDRRHCHLALKGSSRLGVAVCLPPGVAVFFSLVARPARGRLPGGSRGHNRHVRPAARGCHSARGAGGGGQVGKRGEA